MLLQLSSSDDVCCGSFQGALGVIRRDEVGR